MTVGHQNIFNRIFYREKKVNLFLVGQRKCGTTSLHTWLTREKSNGIQGSKIKKEPNYWHLSELKSISAYEEQYNLKLHRSAGFRLDSSTPYAWANEGLALQRIAAYNPKAKILFMIRNPVDRFFSDYKAYAFKQVQKFNKPPRRNENRERRRIVNYLYDKSSIEIDEFCNLELSESPVFMSFQLGIYKDYIAKIKATGLDFLILDFKELSEPEALQKRINSFLDSDFKFRKMNVKNQGEKYEVPTYWRERVDAKYREIGINPEQYFEEAMALI